MPVLRTMRPADANESAQAWREAIDHDGPTCLVLSRQGLPTLDPELLDVAGGGNRPEGRVHAVLRAVP